MIRVTENKVTGFTLIELLIVIAILGILVTLALPSYQSYANKAKFQEVIMATAPYKLAADLAVQLEGLALADLDAGQNGIPAGIASGDSENQYLDSITVADGVVTAVGKNISGDTRPDYILQAEIVNGQIKWSVSDSSTCLAANLC